MAEKFTPPSPERLTLLALRVLEDALAQKERGKVKRNHSHRLALAWLAHAGIGLEWHYKAFWDAIEDEHLNEEKESYRQSYRTRDLIGLLNYWWYDIGREPPCLLERAEWAGKRYAPVPPSRVTSPASSPAAPSSSPAGE